MDFYGVCISLSEKLYDFVVLAVSCNCLKMASTTFVSIFQLCKKENVAKVFVF